MTTLILSPPFASHYQPLAVFGAARATEGERVVVATAARFRERVLADGFEWRELDLSGGHNGGVSRPEEQHPQEAVQLREFFTATRRGAVETLLFQASRRNADLLWEPETVARQLDAVVSSLRPRRIVTDHVSLTATAALRGLGLGFETFVPGHPSQLPVGDELYGVPPSWPEPLDPGPDEHTRLRAHCATATERAAERFNRAVRAIGSSAADVADPFRVRGERVWFNYAERLHDPERGRLLDFPHCFLDGCVRTERLPGVVGAQVARLGGRRLVYVSLGTFLSERGDVLASIAADLRTAGMVAAIATGSTAPERLGPVPDDWIVAPVLPQVALLRHAAAAITHAGCNSVVEALAVGVPMLALPFSTDQFATSADLVRTGLGRCLDPNALAAGDVTDGLEEIAAVETPAA